MEVTYYCWRGDCGGLKSDQVKRLKDLETENARLRKAISNLALDKLILQEAARGNYRALPIAARASSMFASSMASPSVVRVRSWASTARRTAGRRRGRDDEERLTADIIELAQQYGRYGYRKVAALLHHAGWLANHERVERIWRREGLKVPAKQPKLGRLWQADGSCVRLRPQHCNHVWSIWSMAVCICARPVACSWAPAAMSVTTSFISATCVIMRSSALPASATSCTPYAT